jgi:hypothetical protein
MFARIAATCDKVCMVGSRMCPRLDAHHADYGRLALKRLPDVSPSVAFVYTWELFATPHALATDDRLLQETRHCFLYDLLMSDIVGALSANGRNNIALDKHNV